MRRVVLAGGSGFLGRELAGWLPRDEWEPVVLTRRVGQAAGAFRECRWDGKTSGGWVQELDGAYAVVNLAGKSVNCRFNAANRAEILSSRVDSVKAIGTAIRQCSRPPKVWIQASAVGIYGDAGDLVCDESTPPGEGFFAVVCKAWEAAVEREAVPETRKAVLRIGPVLGTGGGALPRLARLARSGLGGRAGHGRQWMSWLHVSDLNRIVAWTIDHPSASGVFNATGPNPSQNRDFMGELRRALGVWLGPPAPSLAVRIGAWVMGVDASLALTGQRCTPTRLVREGFQFIRSDLRQTLEEIRHADR
jgi:uncharacterized protein (TIGR01777 family)